MRGFASTFVVFFVASFAWGSPGHPRNAGTLDSSGSQQYAEGISHAGSLGTLGITLSGKSVYVYGGSAHASEPKAARDTDGDGLSDVFDSDNDGDGATDLAEICVLPDGR